MIQYLTMGRPEGEISGRIEGHPVVPIDAGRNIEGKIPPLVIDQGDANQVRLGEAKQQAVLPSGGIVISEQVFSVAAHEEQPDPGGSTADVSSQRRDKDVVKVDNVDNDVPAAARTVDRGKADAGSGMIDITSSDTSEIAYRQLREQPEAFDALFEEAAGRETPDPSNALSREMTTKNLAGALSTHIADATYPTEWEQLDKAWHRYDSESKRQEQYSVNVPSLARIDADIMLQRAGVTGMIELRLEDVSSVPKLSPRMEELGKKAAGNPDQQITAEQLQARGLMEGLRRVTGFKWTEVPTTDQGSAARDILQGEVDGANKALSNLLERSRGLIRFQMDRMASPNSREETFSLGGKGLGLAAHNYDWRKGFAFSTYAVKNIRDAIVRENFDPDRPKEVFEAQARIKEALNTQGGASLTVEQIADMTKIDKFTVENYFRYNQGVGSRSSLDQIIQDEGDNAFLSTTGDRRFDPAEKATDSVIFEQVIEQVNKLPEPYRQVVIDTIWGGKTQSEIAKELGIIQPTVSKYLSRAYAKLREQIGDFDE